MERLILAEEVRRGVFEAHCVGLCLPDGEREAVAH